MGTLDRRYIEGVARAFSDTGLIRVDNIEKIARVVESRLSFGLEKLAMMEGGGQPPQATPDELAQVSNSGLTENDIQAAAKVVQVIAEMKQQADQSQMGAQQMPGGQPGGQMPGGQMPGGQMPGGAQQPQMGGGQPPMPPPPQPAGQMMPGM